MRRWRSTLRGPWLTSVLGLLLPATLPVVFGPALPAYLGWVRLPILDWPTRPMWLYRGTQDLHVELGLVLVSVVLAKLWSVLPRLFAWPQRRSLAQVRERLSITMLVGGTLFELAAGVLCTRYNHVDGFGLFPAPYYGARVLISGFKTRIVVEVPRMISALRSTPPRDMLRTNRADTRAESLDPDGLMAAKRVTLRSSQFHDRDALLALRVNGANPSLDLGYPVRTIESRHR